jgi:hypothetical protein
VLLYELLTGTTPFPRDRFFRAAGKYRDPVRSGCRQLVRRRVGLHGNDLPRQVLLIPHGHALFANQDQAQPPVLHEIHLLHTSFGDRDRSDQAAGRMRRGESPLRLRDAASGKPILLNSCSCAWNAYRKR